MKIRSSNIFLTFGYIFMYLPLLCVVIYSFNESRFANVWEGFSLKWYKLLLSDTRILRATWTSFKVGAISATLSVILGTMAALLIVRFRAFRGKTLFVSMITAPLVMPEVITGLSLLMLFIIADNVLGWPSGRGMTTICISHTTLTISYVSMIIQARLRDLDKSIEEAALDLGASPVKVFFLITLPIIMPSICLGWLLAFALSLDDVIIASFVSGPGTTTLPMIVFSSLKYGISPEINALATIIMVVLSIIVIIAGTFIYKRKNVFE